MKCSGWIEMLWEIIGEWGWLSGALCFVDDYSVPPTQSFM